MPNTSARLAAWSVHLFTATGLLAGFMGLLAVADGDYRAAMGWLMLSLLIDGIDGTFARLFRVREVLPTVDGKTIDYVIDFFTYCILPAYFFYEAVPVPEGTRLLGPFLMLLSGALYYGREGMVSADGAHFVGFPVLWNLVVYMQVFVLMSWPGWLQLVMVAVFAVLHFVPLLVAYPSRGARFFPLTLAMIVLFIISVAVNVWYYPDPPAAGKWASGVATLYFAVLAIWDTLEAGGKR